MNTYRIYWPDLDDYSSVQGDILDWVIQHGKNCGMPFVVVDDQGFPNGIVYVWLGKLEFVSQLDRETK